MKKRKPPILLATLLIVLLGMFIIINRPPSAPTPEQGPEGQNPEASQATSRPTEKPGDVSKDMKESMNKNGPPAGAVGKTVDPDDPHLVPPGSKITIPEFKPHQPKPDTGTISSARTLR